MQEWINWIGQRPVHFGILVLGVVACFWAMTSSCARVMEAEYQYKIERNKSWERESQHFWQKK